MNKRNRIISRYAVILKSPENQFQMLQRIICKEKWIFHKGDKDSTICIPHGHLFKKIRGKIKEFKLELWTGKIYDADTKELVGRANSAEIYALCNDIVFQQFVAEARKAYNDAYPSVYLKPLLPNQDWAVVENSQISSAYTLIRKINRKRSIMSYDLRTEWLR